MKKFDKIKRAGHDQNRKMFQNDDDRLVVKEKMDGANFRWTYNDDGKPVFGSKNVEYKIDGEPDYSENVDGRFTDAIEFVRVNADVENFKGEHGDPSRYTFFAENMVSHTLQYNWGGTPQVLGFDVYDHEKERYLTPLQARTLFSDLGIPNVPRGDDMTVEEFKEKKNSDKDIVPRSEYRDGKAEGVVLVNVEHAEPDRSGFNYRAKVVTDEFAEKHKKATGARQSKEAVNDHEKVVSKYCTDGRIRKAIHKMEDEGRELGMEMMENSGGSDGLPVRVSKDIIEEEYDDFATSNWKVDFKKFRSLVADRCVHVLRQEIGKL